MQKLKICHSNELKNNQSIKFKISEKPYEREGFVFRHEGKVYAYYNECAHIALPLDWDDNDFFSIDLTALVCKNHGAEFIPETGECTIGPCRGAYLKKIDVIEDDGIVFAFSQFRINAIPPLRLRGGQGELE